MSTIQIINDIEVSCSVTSRNVLDGKTWTGTVQPGNTQVIPGFSQLFTTTTVIVVRNTTTYTYNESSFSSLPTYTLSRIFGPRQYKQTDTASIILSEDDLKVYIAAGGKSDDTIARLREFVKEKARLGEEAK